MVAVLRAKYYVCVHLKKILVTVNIVQPANVRSNLAILLRNVDDHSASAHLADFATEELENAFQLKIAVS